MAGGNPCRGKEDKRKGKEERTQKETRETSGKAEAPGGRGGSRPGRGQRARREKTPRGETRKRRSEDGSLKDVDYSTVADFGWLHGRAGSWAVFSILRQPGGR